MNRATLLLLCVAHMAVAFAQQNAVTPKPVVPIDPITGILNAFKSHNVVALGELHGNEADHAFMRALIRDPRFAATVNDIVVEFGNGLYQDVMDRFVRGEPVADKELRQVWQNITQPHGPADRPIYEQFFHTVREVNASLPKKRQLRVLLGDSPIDWNRIHSEETYEKEMGEHGDQGDRDRFVVNLLQREVLKKRRRALIVYGGFHLLRKNLYYSCSDNEEAEKMFSAPVHSIVGRLESTGRVKVFSIWTHGLGDVTKLQPDIASWQIPSLVVVRDTNWGLAPFMTFYPATSLWFGCRSADGKEEMVRPDPQRSPSMQQQFDAVLYLGLPSTFTYSRITAALCADPEYIEMRTRRMALFPPPPPPPGAPAGAPRPDPAAQLKRQCAAAMAK